MCASAKQLAEQAVLLKAPATLEIPSLIISARTIVQQDHGDVKLILFFFLFFFYLEKGLPVSSEVFVRLVCHSLLSVDSAIRRNGDCTMD